MKLKLYVWEGVLTDYTDGLVCILAECEADAWELLRKKDVTAWWVLQGEPHIEEDGADYSTSAYHYLTKERKFKFDAAIPPKEFEEPMAFLVWGGG